MIGGRIASVFRGFYAIRGRQYKIGDRLCVHEPESGDSRGSQREFRRRERRQLRGVAGGIRALLARIEEEPKSFGWKMRAKIGDRKRWYDLPEEVEGGP